MKGRYPKRAVVKRAPGIAAAALLLLAGWGAYRTFGPPVALLMAWTSDVRDAQVESEEPEVIHGEPRTVSHVNLVRSLGDTVRIVLSLPDPVPEGPLPVLLILGGLEVGEETLEFRLLAVSGG